jgi:hypothetical protein
MVRPLVALVGLLFSQVAQAAPPRFVDYVYVEANEGGSSGGHTAIRFGDATYHFQHERPGLLHLRRDDSEDFRYRYGVLENRTMHSSRIAVSDDTYARLRWQFSERYLSERKQFAHADALRADRTLLALLLARRHGDMGGTLRLRGAGFFFPDDGRSPPSPVALALRARIRDLYGPHVISRRTNEVWQALTRITPGANGPPDDEIPAEGYPRYSEPFSARYRDLLTQLAALEALDRALPLRPDARRTAVDDGFVLDDAERRMLGAFADRLTDHLARLLSSSRPDWGFAFLIGMARLEVLRESERTGHLVLLDAFPPDSELVPVARRHRDALLGLIAEARHELVQARTRLRTTDEIGEEGFAALEAAGNRVLELETALGGTRELRVSAGPLLPARDAPWRDLVVPDVADDDLARSLAKATTAERHFADQLERRYAYDLITHNCVSELFRTVDGAGVDLGGHVDTPWSLDFIPFVSARAVDDTWDVVERTTQWSYRRSRLADMYQRENPLGAWLRESNVLTSTIYRRNDDDSFFLLFTDDVVAPRPLFGAVNLAVGLGAGVAGLALLPVDHGHLLMSGVRGALFSLPELAFVSLRKGSFDYVPRE